MKPQTTPPTKSRLSLVRQLVKLLGRPTRGTTHKITVVQPGQRGTKKHTVAHAVANVPELHIAGHTFKASFQQHDPDREILLWVNKGATFTTFANLKQCAAWIVRYLVRAGVATAKTVVAAAAAPAAKAVAKKAKDFFPAKKDYKVGTFTRAGLFAFWRKNDTGTWRIGVTTMSDAHERNHARLVDPVLWNRMCSHGILNTFASV